VYIPYPRHIKAVGFKLFYTHNSEGREAWKWLQDRYPTLKVIHLTRENLLRVHVSYLISQETRQWVKTAGQTSDSQPPMRVHVNLSEWEKRMQYMDAMRSDALSFFEGHDMLQVTYFDLTGNWDETTRHIQTFLGVPLHPLKRSTRRQNPHFLSELITNYDEVHAALCGTEREWMLKESHVSSA
jgi:LPS sulfotransferase NodH